LYGSVNFTMHSNVVTLDTSSMLLGPRTLELAA
jgi:hypothetical protein